MVEFIKLRQQYTDAARRYLSTNGQCEDMAYMVDIVSNIMMHRDKVSVGNSFVQSICRNDLRGTVETAPTSCLKHLRTLVMAHQNVFI
jgi:hypothetical protein